MLHCDVDKTSNLYIELALHAVTKLEQSNRALDLVVSRKLGSFNLDIAMHVSIHLIFAQRFL